MEIILQTLTGALDSFIFPMALLAITIFAPWRIFIAIPLIHKKDKLGKKRIELFQQLGWAFVDFGCFLLSILVVITIYRLPALLYGLYKSVTFKNNFIFTL
jgi:hypothetical protein